MRQETGATRVLVLGGGANAEHEVSLASAAAVRGALRESGYPVVGLTIARDGSWATPAGAPVATEDAVGRIRRSDVVFPALHGADAEDGTVAGFLRCLGATFVGSAVRPGALAMDKWAAKLIAERLGIRTAAAVLAHEGGAGALHPPLIVKPVASGSSYGAARVEHRRELAAAIAHARTFDDRVLVEEFVVGREIDIAVLRCADGRLRLSPPLEIVKAPDAVFDTSLKYQGAPEFIVPAALAPGPEDRLRACARAIYAALGCDGVARIDFFVTGDEVIFNEANTMPGLTRSSQVPLMFAADGLPFEELCHELTQGALSRGHGGRASMETRGPAAD